MDIQLALVEYRDLPPQDYTFAARVSPFTKDVTKMLKNVKQMQADGGGDCPESVASALNAVLSLPFRRYDCTYLIGINII